MLKPKRHYLISQMVVGFYLFIGMIGFIFGFILSLGNEQNE